MTTAPFKPFYYSTPGSPAGQWSRIFVYPIKDSTDLKIEMIGRNEEGEFYGDLSMPLDKLDALIERLREASWALHKRDTDEDSWHLGESI